MFSLSGLSLRQEPETVEPAVANFATPAGQGYFPGTVKRPCFRSRNGVQYLVCRNWSAASKKADVAAFKRFKAELQDEGIDEIVGDMADLLGTLYGDASKAFGSVVPVACGHSKRPDCLSFRIAARLADRLGVKMVTAFKPRFVSGVSHPKEFRKLPPLEWLNEPSGPALVVDDAATSGFHMHEALNALRDRGMAAIGVVFISGKVTVKAADD